jgi:hypothetical protein
MPQPNPVRPKASSKSAAATAALPPKKTAAMPDARSHGTPKRVFLHLLMIAMLYVSVIASLTLYFQYINHFFFDPVLDFRLNIFNGIRWGSAVLVVAFPVLVYTTVLISKEFKADPALRQMKMRRWLLYFTQFITAITIIVDLMVLVYRFYGGELTIRFGLKILAVLIVAALVLGYYRWELKRTALESAVPRIVTIVVSLVLAVSLGSAFFVAGTPAEQRAIRLDEQRVSHLQQMQSFVYDYASSERELPQDIAALTAWAGELPTDPETGAAYVYRKTASDAFDLCATFSSTTEGELTPQYGPEFARPAGEVALGVRSIGIDSWDHPEGEYCFDRQIQFTSTTTTTPTAVPEKL